MQDILNNYPWMIYTIAICALLLIVVIVLILVVKGKGEDDNEFESNDSDKLINDYLKEEKKIAKKAAIEEEYKEIVEAQKAEAAKRIVTPVSEVEQTDTTDEMDYEEGYENEENEDMLKKKRANPITTKTRRTTDAKTAPVAKAVEKRTPNGKYEVFVSNGDWQYILKASNGEKLVESKKYSTKDNVLNAIDSVKRNLEDGKVSIAKDKSGYYQFQLAAANNRSLATSANYSSEQNAKNALNSFKRFAATSPIVEVEAPTDTLSEKIEVTTQDLKVNGKITIEGSGKDWSFQLTANNGELLCSSQKYTSKDNCQKGIDTLKANVQEGSFEVVKDKNNLYQFKLFSKANRLIVIGQTYEDKQRAIKSANSVASFVINASVSTK